jgi:AraC-like DNA-binding protein
MKRDALEKKTPKYLKWISPETSDELKRKIWEILVDEKAYKDKSFSAKTLAERLNTNTRYVSLVLNTRFQKNYTSFVNGLRVEEAMRILVDKKYAQYSIQDISDMVGFSCRQSFYNAFMKTRGLSPQDYRETYGSLSNTETV